MVQLVECFLAKEEITGSNPVARSKITSNDELLVIIYHGDVAKWQGKGLQNPDHGFKSRRRLKAKKTLKSELKGSFLI